MGSSCTPPPLSKFVGAMRSAGLSTEHLVVIDHYIVVSTHGQHLDTWALGLTT